MVLVPHLPMGISVSTSLSLALLQQEVQVSIRSHDFGPKMAKHFPAHFLHPAG